MRCPRCRQDNPPQAKFCLECGAGLAPRCAGCGAELTAGAKFCNQCGSPAAAAGETPSPRTYTPRHLAERDPEEARKLLDPVLERMMEAVHHYEGTVNQVMGDGVMALFGAPLAHEDHAVRACYAALRMQEAIRRYSEEARRRHGIEVRIRVGLNSGEVVVRSIGNDLRMDYTAVGQTTHLASRMEQLALPGTIRLTAATLALAEGYVEVKPLGPVPVKGLPEPVEVYELSAASAARSRLQAARARGLTRFVGRDREMEELRRAAEETRGGRGQVAAVVGEPGVGKSRLYYEFVHSHHAHGWLVVESGSVSYGKATAYLPLADLFRAYFKIEARDDIRAVRAKVTGNLLTLDESLKDALPPALWLLDVLPEDSPFLAADPAERRRQTLTAAKRILLRESEVQPLLLVFEDLHWIDGETQAFLDSLVESLPGARILLAVNYRPEYRHGWGARSFYRQLRIDPLPPQSAQALLEGLLGAEPSVQPLKSLLIERTQGNPLFLEESVRTLAESGTLSGQRGAYRLAGSLDAVRVPATVQAILAARIDRLEPADKRLLQAAAVVGSDVPYAILEAVAGLSAEALRGSLGRLQAAELLYESRLFPELEYSFHHALTHDVAYGGVLQERKRALHAAIMAALEHIYADRLAEQVELLAHHAFHGAVPGRALHYLREAGTRAVSRSANRQAIGFFEQALGLLAEQPQTPETMRETVDLRIALGPALVHARGAASPDFERSYLLAEALVERLNDDSRRFPVLWGLWYRNFHRGEYAEAAGRAEGLLEAAQRSGDSGLILEGHHSLWATLSSMGRSAATLDHIKRGAALYDRAQHASQAFVYGGHDAGVCCFYHRAMGQWLLGFPDDARASVRQAVALAEELGHPQTLVLALWFCAWVQFQRGELDEAGATAGRCDTLATMHQMSRRGDAGGILASVTPTAQDLDAVERGIREATSTAWRGVFNRCLLAELHGKAGRPDRGREILRALSPENRGAFYAAEIARLEGELILQCDASAVREAERCFDGALQLARTREEKSLELRAAMSLARLRQRQGRREEAHALLAPVHAWFTEGFDTADLRAARELLKELA